MVENIIVRVTIADLSWLTLAEMAGSPIADPTEAVDRLLDLREVVEVGLLAAFTEALEPCLDVANLAEVVDAAGLTDDVDPAFFVPVTEVDDLMEEPDVAFIALPTEEVDSCLGVSDRVDVAFFVPTNEVVELYSQDGCCNMPAESC